MNPVLKNKYFRTVLLIAFGLFLGWLFFHHSSSGKSENKVATTKVQHKIWTCSMHPQIRMEAPGQCPICGMDLIPLVENATVASPDAIVMSESAMQIANVQTSTITRQLPVKEIRLFGKIQPDERLIQTLPAHIPGRIDRLFVNFTGEYISKGQTIALIYSPELVTAQQELLESLKFKDANPGIVDAARDKLRQWMLTSAQISQIEKSKKVKEEFEVKSMVSGTVLNRRVNVGDHVGTGQSLFELVNLSKVWAMFDAYESDLSWIKKGSRINFTVESMPDKNFSGTISFIDPIINPQTRVARVRVEVENTSGMLKPEMFAKGVIRTQLGNTQVLVVPKSAVLWTGTRSVVYVKSPDKTKNAFTLRDVTLGSEIGDYCIVSGGVKDGEVIVTNGAFAVDAAAQLSGKPSMMNPVPVAKVKKPAGKQPAHETMDPNMNM
ncbi:MAG: efflux RND transporter periplasmic adaptor subunit [Bacteroidota bacterium]|nr:efflux RND transporter periplasmic adaptor subunit [Bacteroidota bacterium]